MKILKILARTVLVLFVVAAAGFAWLVSQYAWPINIPLASLRGGIEADEERLDEVIQLPDGFTFSVYATGLKSARMLLALPGGNLLVSAKDGLRLLRADSDKDGRADEISRLDLELSRATGMAFHEGHLYIAEDNAIGRAVFDPLTGALGTYERIVTGLTSEGNHWTKTIGIGPDGLLYMTSGSTCNVCEEEDPRRAAMMRFNLDGSDGKIFATGLRNSVGFDWAPDGALYATENGRDLLGNDFPPEELNRIEEGKFYGWPYINGFGVADPDFGPGNEDKATLAVSPAHGFRPHNAPLGMRFVGGKALPEKFDGAALVALHGSWNRSQKDGYKVVSLHFDPQGGITETDFMTGFLTDGKVIGRPVDVAQDEAGALYVSDDFSGTIYKVVFGGEQGQVAQTKTYIDKSARETFSAELIEEGEAIFVELGCGGCHVPDEPDPANTAPRLENLAERYTADDIAALLDTPPGPMPRFDLTKADKQALAAYVLTTF